jgi:2-(1,2-epoxy-1,2-dihydrophenyl)acetyl-CoA isomerase
MSAYREILYEVDEQVATVTFNRPEQRNPISTDMLEEVGAAVRAAQQDDDVRVLVLTGAGRAFCSGGDVKSMAHVASAGAAALSARQEQVGLIQETQLLLRRFPKVLIAAVNGAAYGAGLDLACAADFRLAADTARFCEVYVRLGLAPGGGGAWLLPRIVGLTNALDLILSGEPIDAEAALRIGLVSRVVPAADLPAATRDFALRFALSAPRGVQVAKRAVLRGAEMSFEAALDFIRPQIGVLRQTEDHKEGLRALRERRLPRFEGR